ncbi:sugar phosphate nucleotidyltransferase [Promethearchaeum syntrophicum]|uniref:Sugar phosphate nucleotidyltransferase n=1 Tax=Promethearchaeum syntrophicum TaxID=2594042 RepID=A0A5B9D8T4_9ARCH|nr:NDP-sugar synthase [Candidatus Prometheoarchaeum syntrophicum]QEE15678.1 Bifunctional protein GlmU [Candidatus Prometheoarchaeum syntrophicum]
MVEKWSAVILAGGLGSRLNPLTAKICKPMVPVCNRPMVDYAIDHLRYAGIKKIIIVVKHLGNELRDLINSTWTKEICENLGIEILIPKVNSMGTADAVRKVADEITSENFVVSMADIVTNLPMTNFMTYHLKKKAQATVSMKRIEEMATKYGNTLLDNDGKIIRFLEKPSSQEIYLSALTRRNAQTLPIINTGIYCFNREILDLIKETTFMDFGKEIFPYLLEHQYRLYGFVDDYYWLDVGNPTTYLWSNWDILRLYGWPITPPGSQEEKFKWFLEKPPSHLKYNENICIGKNCTFGQNNYISSLSSIGSNCTFGVNVKVDKSVIWDNVKIGNNVIIEQSVVANGSVIGDDCVIKSNTIIGPHSKIRSKSELNAKTLQADSNI